MGRLRVGNMPGGLHIEDVDTVVKVITVGNGAVGKTSLIRRFCEGVFTGVYQKTLAVDFVEKQDFVVPGVEEPVTLHVWDTAGQEEYDAITSGYYRGDRVLPLYAQIIAICVHRCPRLHFVLRVR